MVSIGPISPRPRSAGLGELFVPGRDAWGLDGGVVWTPVKNLEIRAEAAYVKAEDYDGTVSGFVWFLRSF